MLLAVHKIGLKIKSEVVILALPYLYRLVLKLYHEFFIRSIKLIVEYVVYSVSVY